MGKKHLMIVESPAKAKTIEKYLGGDFIVKASFGHVRDLPKGDDAIDVDKGFKAKYEVLPEKKDVIRDLKKLSEEAESVWLATDEDREGEAISWHLAEVLGLDARSAKRVVFNEITKPAILRAIEHPRLIDLNLVNAQQARRVLDRLVGFKISPILWSKIRSGLSAGRVQSVAVRLIVEREREIIAFQEESAFRIMAEFVLDNGQRLVAELPDRLKTESEADSFLQSCIQAAFQIRNLETKPAKKSPAAPFTTSTLQQEASRKLGFSVAQTMRVAQSLYESGLISYMRTDSVNLSDQALGQIQSVIEKDFGPQYHQFRRYRSKVANAQEAHEAIRPTDMARPGAGADRNEQRLYELIWKRTIASQMADASLERTTATIGISTSSRVLLAQGEMMVFDGFLRVYMESRDEEEDDTENGVLPPLKVGQSLNMQRITARERYSKHPPRYTEASLVKKLEEQGIGRPSTYAPTISTIQQREYVEKDNRDGTERNYRELTLERGSISRVTKKENTGAEKGKLFPTDLGMLVTDFLLTNFPSILDYRFTAQVEAEFDEIANGSQRFENMLGGFYGSFSETVQNTKDTAERVNKERVLGTHPESGLPVIAKFGRFGPFVQIGVQEEGGAKPKFASLRKDQRLDTLTMEEALELFRLPRVLGTQGDLEVRVNVGRFGPYVQLGKEFFSIPKGEDPLGVSLERALEIMQAKREAEANRVIHDFGPDCQVLNGRFGPYVKMNGLNLKIPKGVKAEELTLEECQKLYEAQKDSAKPARGAKAAAAKTGDAKKPAAKKPAAKKTAAKKPAAKKAAPKKK